MWWLSEFHFVLCLTISEYRVFKVLGSAVPALKEAFKFNDRENFKNVKSWQQPKAVFPFRLQLSSLSEIMGKPAPFVLAHPCSSAVTLSKYCCVIWVRRRKTRSTQTPTEASIKLWFISTWTECTRTRGHVFTPGFFIFQQRRGGGGEVTRGRQTEWSHGSCLGRADQTSARQAEWTIEYLSSCRVHGVQWKATHLVGGPVGQGISALTLSSYHKGATEWGRQKFVLSPPKRNGGKQCLMSFLLCGLV